MTGFMVKAPRYAQRERNHRKMLKKFAEWLSIRDSGVPRCGNVAAFSGTSGVSEIGNAPSSR